MNIKLYFFVLAIIAKLLSINISFGQATVTRANLTICSSVSYTALGTITISEGDNDDFDISPSSGDPIIYSTMYYNLQLPTGFEFDVASIPAFSYTGSAANFSNQTPANPFDGVTRVKFEYKLLPNADNEKTNFTISGLKVKCITPGANGNIYRINTDGDDGDIDGVPSNGTINHGTLDSRLSMTLNYQSATLPGACVNNSIHVMVTWTSTPPATVDYVFHEGGTNFSCTEAYRYSNYTVLYVNLPDAGNNKDCKLVITSNGCVYETNIVRITQVKSSVTAASQIGTPPTFNTFGDPVPMAPYIKAATGTTITYMYTTKDGSWTSGIGNSGGTYFFLPSAGKGEHVINYQVRDDVSNCYAYYTLPDPFVVVDPLSPNPEFVSPKQTPLCEDGGYYKFKFTAPLGEVKSVTFHYKDGDSTANNFSGNDIDLYLNPKKQKNYMIPVTLKYEIGPLDFSSKDTFYIYPKRDVSIQGLPTAIPDLDPNIDTVYVCSANKDTVILRGVPTSGTFNFYRIYKNSPKIYRWFNQNSAGLVSNSLDPSTYKFVPNTLFTNAANSSDSVFIVIEYLYPALGGGLCPTSKTIYLKFYQPTNLSYQILSPLETPYCYGDIIKLKGLTLPDQPTLAGDSLNYTFGDGITTGWVKADTTINKIYGNPGEYSLRVTTKRTEAVCNNDHLDKIKIGAKPIADFDIYKNFNGEKSNLISLSKINVSNISNRPGSMDTINVWSWDLGIDNTLNYINEIDDTINFQFPEVTRDPYVIIHKVKSGWGCVDSVIKHTPIFDIKTPTTSSAYTEDFDNTTEANSWYASGWYERDTLKSSWRNEPANEHKIKADNNGANWITSGYSINNSTVSGKTYKVTYEGNEISWVESPVFDLEDLTLPMISMDTWTNADNLFDGASLQYTICDSVAFGKEKWTTLGSYNTGLNWYNSFTVVSRPGGNLNGWTDTIQTGWNLSASRLNHLKDSLAKENKKLLRFRIIFASNGDNTPNKNFDGFAFDNVYIGERNRRVLVEEFCDYATNESGLDVAFGDPQAIRIQYHLRTHKADDIINNQNRAEPSARALLYGVGKALPRGIIDGILSNNELPLMGWGPDEFLKRSLYVSPFEISINPPVKNNGSLEITTNVKKTSSQNLPGPFVVQIAIVEKEVIGNEGEVFTNVLRNMVPNSAGNRIRKNFFTSKTDTTISGTWTPFITPNSDIMVVVFIQDENTKEVYQSYYVTVTPNGLEAPENRGGGAINQPTFNEVALSPNPTSGDLKILFNGILIDDYTCTITDGYGKVLQTSTIHKNSSAAIIDTYELSSGLYYVMLEGQGQRIVKKFSLIK